MIRETGKPKFDGRHVAYVEGHFGWLEPVILTWMKNGWHYQHTQQPYPDEVFFWYALPVINLADWTKLNEENSQCPTPATAASPAKQIPPPPLPMAFDL